MRHLWQFTPKEAEVARMLCDGKSLFEIARETHKTYETVRNQLRVLKSKTETHTQLQLAVKLIRSEYEHA